MDFTYDDEQKALREAVSGLLSRAYGDSEQRRRVTAADPGFDEKTWARLAEQERQDTDDADASGRIFLNRPRLNSACAAECGRAMRASREPRSRDE